MSAPDDPQATVSLTHPPEQERDAERLGDFVVTGRIGAGGMGDVLQVHDADLGRELAAKVTRGPADAQALAKFIQEARITGQLEHPNIVPVHQLQTDPSGRVFFTMKRVAGRTLGQMLRDEDQPSLVGLLQTYLKVCDAVAFAHSRGVIHRDLKPDNVMVGPFGEVLVLDWGLAKPIGEAELPGDPAAAAAGTLDGTVMGTPAYMPPEQAAGEIGKLDEKSDVYALGAVLYELLAGRPPLEGDDPLALVEAARAGRIEPPSAAAPHRRIPWELESVVQKAMALRQEERYATVPELQAEIVRYLEGLTLHAARYSPRQRLFKWIGRNKARVTVAAALLAAVAVGGWSLAAAHRRKLAEQRALTLLRERTRVALWAALELRRAGAVGRQSRFAAETERICREAMERMPASPEPHYRLARMYRALQRDAQALAELDRALRKDPRFGPALYERVVLQVTAYFTRASELLVEAWRAEGARLARGGPIGGGAVLRAPSPARLIERDARAGAMRKRIEADLRALDAAGGAGEAQMLCARGLLAFLHGRPAEAGASIRRALALEPGLEEGHEALARIALEQGDHAGSVACWLEGLRHFRGYARFEEGLGHTRHLWANVNAGAGRNPELLYQKAIEDFSVALRSSPSRDVNRANRATVRINWGIYLLGRGRDPTALFKAAVEDYDRALAANPASDWHWVGRGVARINWAAYLQDTGGNSSELLGAAIADLTQAIARNPRRAWSWQQRGGARANLGGVLMARGRDPTEQFTGALADLDQALERNPGDAVSWSWRGVLRTQWAADQIARGRDPAPLFGAAVADLDQAARRWPTIDRIRILRAIARSHWGYYLQATGRDPLALYAGALEDLEAALRRNPENAMTWAARGQIRKNRADFLSGRGQSPIEEYRAAIADYDQALARNPRSGPVLARRGGASLAWGNHLWQHLRQDASAQFTAAQSDLDAALRANPRNAESWLFRGNLYLSWGLARVAFGLDPENLFGAAEQDFTAALQRNDRRTDALVNRALARTNLGLAAVRRKADPGSHYRQALADLDRAIEIGPRPAPAWNYRAQLCWFWFGATGDPARGRAALESAKRAIAADPALEPGLRALVAECRARLKKK